MVLGFCKKMPPFAYVNRHEKQRQYRVKTYTAKELKMKSRHSSKSKVPYKNKICVRTRVFHLKRNFMVQDASWTARKTDSAASAQIYKTTGVSNKNKECRCGAYVSETWFYSVATNSATTRSKIFFRLMHCKHVKVRPSTANLPSPLFKQNQPKFCLRVFVKTPLLPRLSSPRLQTYLPNQPFRIAPLSCRLYLV